MNPAYQEILKRVYQNKAAIAKFFKRLKQLHPKDLDTITHELDTKAWKSISCLDCANCCRTTGPLLLPKDIERLAKTLKQRPSDFVVQYLRIDEEQDYIFKSMPCPFLSEDNTCQYYGSRPNACREYPHTQQTKIISKLKITQQNTFICPAVALVVEGLMAHYNKS